MEIIKLPVASTVYFAGKSFMFVRFDGRDAIIRSESLTNDKRVSPHDLAFFHKGKFIPIQHTTRQGYTIFNATRSKRKKAVMASPIHPTKFSVAPVNLKDIAYLNRKQRQNNQLFDDVSIFLKKDWLSTVRVLALDDFCSSNRQRLNTYKNYFTVYGGRHSNYYLCNPNMDVFRTIYAEGGNGIPLKVGDCLSNRDIYLPPMDVFYLDYTCKWKTAKQDIDTLFQESERLFRPRGVILHITLSKMFDRKSDYEHTMNDILHYIENLGIQYGYNVTPTRIPYATKTMFKIGVFIQKKS